MWYSVKDYTGENDSNLIGVARRFDHVPTLADFGLTASRDDYGRDDYEICEVDVVVGNSI